MLLSSMITIEGRGNLGLLFAPLFGHTHRLTRGYGPSYVSVRYGCDDRRLNLGPLDLMLWRLLRSNVYLCNELYGLHTLV